MKLCVLGSGSRGNAILMQAGTTKILIDAGFAPRTLSRRLETIGVDPRSISAVVLTHEHFDHARGAAISAKKWGWSVFATAGTTGASLDLVETPVHTISSSGNFTIDDFELHTARTSHDADEPVAVIATCRQTGARAAIVYDLGVMTEELNRSIQDLDVLVIESNHDPEMLRNGPYPWSLQRRIASRHGHLNNRSAGVAAARCAHRGLKHVILAHLSETNNTPSIAIDTMRIALSRTAFKGEVVASRQDAASATIGVAGSRRFVPVQLSLGI
ncbi:MAG TPA: MBL fold metallo-hydrolase [Gemmatimonadaceae bacterium]|nr:MBL fold metallo-hydrolase [Gemmatimonadaceae bacterium]